jgi:hypothetical protein
MPPLALARSVSDFDLSREYAPSPSAQKLTRLSRRVPVKSQYLRLRPARHTSEATAEVQLTDGEILHNCSRKSKRVQVTSLDHGLLE